MTYMPVKKWHKIYEALKTIRGLHLSDERRLKRFFEGVLFVSKSGCPWRYVPWTYGRWRGIHMKFKDWCKRGIWRQLFEALKGDPDGETFMIDATIIRAHACAAGQAKDSADIEALGRVSGKRLRRPFHKNLCHGGCTWQSCGLQSHRWPAL